MKKKVLSLLLAVVMTFSLAVTANAAEETAQDLDGDIVILHTNDVHGAISGYAKVAALKDAYEARGAYVLLMDAGDFIQGDPTVSTSEGATAVVVSNTTWLPPLNASLPKVRMVTNKRATSTRIGTSESRGEGIFLR